MRAMADGSLVATQEGIDAAYAVPPALFQADAHWPMFERLRREDPVHYTPESQFGPFWSITRFDDIMAVDTNHQVFSSDSMLGGINIGGTGGADGFLPMF